MSDRRSTALTNADDVLLVVGVVLLVVGVVLAAGKLTDTTRDALATVARLGRDRILAAAAALGELAGGQR